MKKKNKKYSSKMIGEKKMVILLDAMGGDKAPDANIKGAVK